MIKPVFTNRVRAIRIALGLSQAQLAAATGLSVNSICSIENGQGPSVRHALLIAKVLKCQVEDLFYFVDLD